MTDFHMDSGEQSVILDKGQMSRLLRYINHTLEIFMWEQDYFLHADEDDCFTDILSGEDLYVDDIDENDTDLPVEPEGSPYWQVRVEYSNHTVQDISCYDNYLPEHPEELYFSLLEYFDSEDDIF